jgi:hypothetical protein
LLGALSSGSLPRPDRARTLPETTE